MGHVVADLIQRVAALTEREEAATLSSNIQWSLHSIHQCQMPIKVTVLEEVPSFFVLVLV